MKAAKQFADAELLASDSLKELRESCRFYLKLDLTYLGAAGAVATAFQLTRSELHDVVAGWWFVVVGYGVCLVWDVVVEHALTRQWIAAASKASVRAKTAELARMVGLQPVFHLLLVGCVVSGFLGYSSGYAWSGRVIKASIVVQEEVDKFVARRKRVPATIDEVASESAELRRALENLRMGDDVKIEKRGPDSYQLVFAGKDKTFGTADDWIATPDRRLRDVWDAMESNQRGIGKKTP